MTVWFALFALVMVTVIAGATYKIKGWKAALIAGGVVLIGLFAVYIGLIYLIVNSMD